MQPVTGGGQPSALHMGYGLPGGDTSTLILPSHHQTLPSVLCSELALQASAWQW